MQEVIAGRYQLGPQLGRGGMAEVRTALDLRLHRAVAVKLLDGRVAPDPAARLRFVREARAAASFSHPHAVAVYDAGDADGVLYLVMELVDGRSLADHLRASGALAVDEAVRIVDEVLQALGAAHRAGIVHRDVKPGNVLVTVEGSAKLADFGIAKRTGEGELTLAGQFVGTPEYLSPEQVSGGPVTPATDLYATGVVLFEALTGMPPFAAGSPLATALAHRDLTPPDVRARRRDVPDHVAGAVARAMAKDPSSRFASADEMRAALAGRITPVAVATHRSTQRWWWAAAAVAVLVAAAVIALDAGSDPQGAPSSPTTVAVTTVAPATTVTTTTVAPTAPTTVPGSAPAATVPTPASLDDLLLLVDIAPIVFGERAAEVRRGLERIADKGRRGDVERLQEQVSRWRQDGSLPAATASIIEAVLAEVSPADEGDGGGGGDDGG